MPILLVQHITPSFLEGFVSWLDGLGPLKAVVARDGELVYENTDWEHPVMVNYAQPIVLAKGQGLRSTVTYNNTTSKAIFFGLTSDDEMDIIFGYYY